MSDWNYVTAARAEADAACSDVDAYGGRIEDTGAGDAALAIMLGARAVCLELRALWTIFDYLHAPRMIPRPGSAESTQDATEGA